jgi:hypothetical protein
MIDLVDLERRARDYTDRRGADSLAWEHVDALARAVLAMLPVVKAAEEWGTAECGRHLETCEEVDVTCDVQRTETALIAAIATLRRQMQEGE